MDNVKKSRGRLLFSAFGVHMGGGLVLLRAILNKLCDPEGVFVLDYRVRDKTFLSDCGALLRYVPRSMFLRFISLHRLALFADRKDLLFSFNGLPPLFRSKAKTVVFIQSAHFVGLFTGARFPFFTNIRLRIEVLWLRLGVRNVDELWVQTPSMKRRAEILYPNVPIFIVPLVDQALTGGQTYLPAGSSPSSQIRSDFFYPADCLPHKNHKILVDAWALLYSWGRCPNLYLTLSESEWASFEGLIDQKLLVSGCIQNLGRISREAVLHHLKSSALIFPSTAETFGLPMVEAAYLRSPIIASELDFVRDVCNPVETFDPLSAVSIARAVCRYLSCSDYFFEPVDPETFVGLLLDRFKTS